MQILFDAYSCKRRAYLCSVSFLVTMAEEALLEAHVALLTAQLRYHQEIVWLQRSLLRYNHTISW